MTRGYAISFDSIPEAERRARGYKRTHPLEIEHSGCRFRSDIATLKSDWGFTYVWPIEELLARETYPPAQAQRIRKLNPYGKPEAAGCVCFEPRPHGRR